MSQRTLDFFFKPKKTSTSAKDGSSVKTAVIATAKAECVESKENVKTQVSSEPQNTLEAESDSEDMASLAVAPAKHRARKRISYIESDSEEEVDGISPNTTKSAQRKQRRIEDDGDEYVPTCTAEEDDEVIGDEMEMDLDDICEDSTPTKSPLTPLRQKFQNFNVSSRPSTAATTRQEERNERSQKFKEKNEVRYSWLTNIRDANKNPIGSAGYDPRTLYVPPEAMAKFTAFERQYWEIKSKHWDTVVFFKKGKFYELYEKDADIGHKDFDLKMTDRTNMRMVGVPESSFEYWASQFIAKGHKVAKVDQTETAIGKTMRERNAVSKVDKVIRRELTAVLTAGTLVDANLLTDDMSTFCMSIKEIWAAGRAPQFGICFVDTATAEFNIVSFEDDLNRTKFETLIMQIQPRELVTEKGCLSQPSMQIIKNCLDCPIWNMRVPVEEFWKAERTIDEVRIGGYFEESTDDDPFASWPAALKDSKEDHLRMSALGGLLEYLRTLKLDKELFSAKNIYVYDPVKQGTSLVLDGQTLANLEIFQNTHDGTETGTLIQLIGNCITPFGKRLFKQWLCHPLRDAADINRRLDAVETFMRLPDITGQLEAALSQLPDLQRLISRIHSGRCKVKEFLMTLDGFKIVQETMANLGSSGTFTESVLLLQLIRGFPDLSQRLDYFQNAFIMEEVDIDYQKIKTIVPKYGVNQEWDALNESLANAEQQFDKHLLQIKKDLKCAQATYKDLGKEIYQVELPKNVKVPREWIQLSATSKVNRYWNSTIKNMVSKYRELLETKNAFLKNFASQVYADFDKDFSMWLAATQRIAQLDALLSLAKATINLGEPSCRPVILDQDKPVAQFEELRHPCVVQGVATDFIPNDTVLGGDNPNIIVLTGPNMGGKSTLLRQTCIGVILAQLGMYVPARSCRLTPCDRIFTRIGANDNIMAGQSTFMVELSETAKILQEATPDSIVILDELGRGTSTFDGHAIAFAVLNYLATFIGCRGIFSTHYHSLCQEFEGNPNISNMHMGYAINDIEVTFLYKLMPGFCEKSYGMNVAAMAGVPQSVISRASMIAEDFEQEHKLQKSDDTPTISTADQSNLCFLFSMADKIQHSKQEMGAIRRLIKACMHQQ